MKNISIIFLISFIMTNNLIAEKPEPLTGYEFEFPDYEIDATKNNIKVILIEDDEQPITNIRLLIGGGNSVEEKPGVAELTAGMLTKGAGDLTALQIAQKLDGIGAQLNIRSTDDFIVINLEVLNKHLDEALAVFEKVVNDPKFDEDELDKLKQLMKASLIAERSNPGVLAGKLAKAAIYGNEHPYAIFPKDEDIDNIEAEDLENYYKKYLHGRNMSLAVYGDFNEESIEKIIATVSQINDDKETKPIIQIPKSETLPKGVYFIPREGSVQSTVRVVFPAPAYNDYDYEILSFNSNIIGASFAGRLFKTLREKYSYTYSPSGGVTNRKFENFFYAAADVKGAVTDSAINVINEQIFDLAENTISKDELENLKKYRSGSYMMNFENSSFVASLIQNSEFKGKNAKTLESYIDRLENFTPKQVQLKAKEYLTEDNSLIVVVGPPTIKEKLEKFGKIYEYNKYIEPFGDYTKIDLDANDLLYNYRDAISKDNDLDDVNSLLSSGKGSATMQGRSIPTELIEYRKEGGKLYQKMEFAGMAQEKWINGEKAWLNAAGMTNEMPLNQSLKLESKLFGVSELEKLGFKLRVLGEKDNMITLEATSKSGTKSRYMFDASTYLLLGSSTIEDTPQGKIDIETKLSDYKNFDGYLMPTKIKSSSAMFSFELEMDYMINAKEDYKFAPNN